MFDYTKPNLTIQTDIKAVYIPTLLSTGIRLFPGLPSPYFFKEGAYPYHNGCR